MYANKFFSKRVPASTLALFTLVILGTRLDVLARSTTTTAPQSPFELDPCGVNTANFTLTPELWKSAGMDQYIAKHPLTQNSTISQFSAALGMSNFFCGIGMECGAGQICYPAIGKDYLLLYAVQQWNNFMNQLYKVIASVTMMLSDSSAVIVTDFIPLGIKTDKSIFGWAVATLVFSVIGMFTGPGVALFLPARVAPLAAAAGAAAQAARESAEAADMANKLKMDDMFIGKTVEQLAAAHAAPKGIPKANIDPALSDSMRKVVQGGTGPANAAKRRLKRDLAATRSLRQGKPHHLQKRGPPNVLAYARWSFLDIHLGRLRTRLQNFISITVKTALATPIYSDAGLAPIIMEGAFLAPNPTWESMAEDTRKLGNIVLLSEFFVSLGFVATIGQDPCRFEGPAGAWGGDNVLSHCDEQGVMRSIVMTDGDNFDHRIRNANLLTQKYKYSVYDLVTRATECQAKFGVYGSNTAPTPVKENSPCAFQLPVCDMSTPGMKKRLDEKNVRKKYKAKACREEYKLPI
ncbi:hypothetical protein MJO28_014007 [Puccinia striiformis f. sp. tritici]|uniref:DUF7872 domain-containing protein n=3 Tax=Puccinia striiformis TaxID=27350 RepID=A0A0L0W0S1_9BASI|nr:hypothetical protein Pst134EA_025487 [Puccinia striiformis f. sp. tritici]KAH9451537.1 hypothetical protein Pst134EA_025487 [Puccinia striiformis f. sp. tritici]KAI7940355.1 hypothetical protein MJO28_014007 [Puccinia striiformis f. sp. tritici]KNF05111.1 hypothetical protein PSTG_01740 [Puccinia striiformis f. sp. tritici PST-78]POW04600.1 hypothetical protein PSHT_11156 [Puccinia striiformis]